MLCSLYHYDIQRLMLSPKFARRQVCTVSGDCLVRSWRCCHGDGRLSTSLSSSPALLFISALDLAGSTDTRKYAANCKADAAKWYAPDFIINWWLLFGRNYTKSNASWVSTKRSYLCDNAKSDAPNCITWHQLEAHRLLSSAYCLHVLTFSFLGHCSRLEPELIYHVDRHL